MENKKKELKINDDLILDIELVRSLENYFSKSPFNAHGCTNYIACVGINGNYGQDTIYEGFKNSVEH